MEAQLIVFIFLFAFMFISVTGHKYGIASRGPSREISQMVILQIAQKYANNMLVILP